MYSFFINQLVLIHAGEALSRIKSTVYLTLIISPMTYIIEKICNWSVANSTYVLFVLGAIAIDHILGTLIHAFIEHDFTFRKNVIGLIIKVGLVVAVGFLFEGLNYIILGDNVLKSYIGTVLRLLVFLYPAGSAFANSSIITGGRFPPRGFLEKLKVFQSNLKIKDLTKE